MSDRSTFRALVTYMAVFGLALGFVVTGQAHATPTDNPPGGAESPLSGAQSLADLGASSMEAPPAPAIAEEEKLPLENAAAVDIDAPPSAVTPVVRDLPPARTPLPPQAVTFSSTNAGPARTLVLYDTTGPYGKFGEYYAMAMGALASHSGEVTTLPVAHYTPGLAGSFTAVIYSGSTYNEPLPQAFIHDVLTGDIPVLWSGFNIWQLSATTENRALFTSRYAWDAATSYINVADQVTAVHYGGQKLTRHSENRGGIVAPNILQPKKVTILGQAECSQSDGTPTECAPIAQSSGTTFPWAIKSGNLTYIGEIPLSYLEEQDRYIAAADIVLNTVWPDATPIKQAAVRIEDISPGVDGAQIQAIVDTLQSLGVPFQLAVIPVYTDPQGIYNNGVGERWTLADNAPLVAALKDAVADGGTLVQHGTTHQWDTQDNPYSAVTSDDFEFIRSWCADSGSSIAPPTECAQSSWVHIGGSLPDDSPEAAAARVREGREIFRQVGLPEPTIFETPHYSATRNAYLGITQEYPVRYERVLFHSGLLSGQPGEKTDYYGQFFPYGVSDLYGGRVLPENLGNYVPEVHHQHSARTVEGIIESARKNTVVTHATASFFYHPFFPVEELEKTVVGIRALGYTFVPAEKLR
ncbi:MAG: polysaccharide deacetylase family protein [Actinomycetaceae bacterium]|nr:polysaccharide deacetylase family protein [Actinomycetaceae bacterium]